MVLSLLLLPNFTGVIRPTKVKDESGEACFNLSQLPALETFSFFHVFPTTCKGYTPNVR